MREGRAGCPSTEGARSIRVKLVDPLGNIGSERLVSVTYDITPPAAPTVNQVSGASVQPASYTVSGSTIANASIEITGATSTVTTTANGAGVFSTAVTHKANQLNTLLIKAKDEAGNQSTATTLLVTHDSIAPTISAGTFVKLTAETMQFSLTASEQVTIMADYGTTAAYGLQVSDSALITTPLVLAADLSQNTVYHYRVTITDRAGNSTMTAGANVRTYIDKSAQGKVDEVWDQTITPYYISGNFRINDNVIVKIKKGVRIALETDTEIWVRGTLIAEGTAAEPITFTSNNPQPTAGSWDDIEFNNTAATAYSTP